MNAGVSMGDSFIYLIVYSDSLEEGLRMSFQSILKMKNKWMLFFTIFYILVGAANLMIVGIYDFGLFHIGLIAILSFVAAFGLYQQQSWVLWPIFAIFFISTVYSVLMINAFLGNYQVNPHAGIILGVVAYSAYLVLTWIGTAYIGVKRNDFN